MDRSMAYDLDGVLGTRNDGQLISQQAPRAVVTRAPGMVEEGDGGPVEFNTNQLITTDTRRAQNLAAFNVEVPVFGELNWKSLALGAGLMYLASRTIFSPKGKKKARAAFAAGLAN